MGSIIVGVAGGGERRGFVVIGCRSRGEGVNGGRRDRGDGDGARVEIPEHILPALAAEEAKLANGAGVDVGRLASCGLDSI